MLKEKYALPGAKKHSAGGDRNGLGGAGEDHAEVARHIVRAFAGVLEPRGILGHEPVEEFMHIPPRGRIGVFHDDQAGAGVPDKNGDNALLDAAGSDNARHRISNFHRSLAAGGNFKYQMPR